MKKLVLILSFFIVLVNTGNASQYIVSTGKIPPDTYFTHHINNDDIDGAVTIEDVPAYLWYHGCAPTTIGMIIGTFDNRGFDFVEGSAITQTHNVNQMIASDEHYDDYSLPLDYRYLNDYPLPDKSATPEKDEHDNNSIADFLETSQSIHRLYYGGTIHHKISEGTERFAKSKGYKIEAKTTFWKNPTWEDYKSEIDRNKPVALFVSTYNAPNHLVVGVGYTEENGNKYGVYSTWSEEIAWFNWTVENMNSPWSVWSMTMFTITQKTYLPIILN